MIIEASADVHIHIHRFFRIFIEDNRSVYRREYKDSIT